MPHLIKGCEVVYARDAGIESLPKLLRLHDGRATVILEHRGVRVAGNVVCNRKALYTILGAGSDSEAYERIINAVNSPKLELSEESFNEHYVKVDRVSYPATRFYDCDGGPYLTGGVFIACINDVCNASIHRMMLLDEKRFAVRVVPRHLYRMLRENKPLPVAVAFGVHPLVMAAAASSPPFGVFELSVAAMLGWNARVCRTPLYGIPVPCDAGIVVEGKLGVEEAEEGPFADILELCDRRRIQPVLRVDAVYLSRSDAWFWQILPAGIEHKLLMGFPREAAIWDSVRRATGREAKVRLLASAGGWLAAIIAGDYDEATAKIALMAAFAAHPSLKLAIVTGGDIDVDNDADVIWALATRVSSSSDVMLIERVRVSTLDPASHDGVGIKLGIVAVPRGPSFKRAKLIEPEG